MQSEVDLQSSNLVITQLSVILLEKVDLLVNFKWRSELILVKGNSEWQDLQTSSSVIATVQIRSGYRRYFHEIFRSLESG